MIEWHEGRVADVEKKYADLNEKVKEGEIASEQLNKARAEILRLSHQVNLGALDKKTLELMISASASMSSNMAHVTGASGMLGHSIATLSLSPGGVSDYVAMQGSDTPDYAQATGATGPTAPTGGRRPVWADRSIIRPGAPLRGPKLSERPEKK
jgi:hypothetical protein